MIQFSVEEALTAQGVPTPPATRGKASPRLPSLSSLPAKLLAMPFSVKLILTPQEELISFCAFMVLLKIILLLKRFVLHSDWACLQVCPPSRLLEVTAMSFFSYCLEDLAQARPRGGAQGKM